MNTYKYSQWDGTQQVFEPSEEEIMGEMAEDLMNHGDLMRSLRNLFQRGLQGESGQRMQGLRDMLERLRNRRQEQLQQYNLDSVLDDLKERLKQMRAEVDILTLTATPIPRTLHMSLAGVRDMSTMETPPEERLPIKTYVSEFSDELIREAILRELDRQGQVYFLHNRVYNIEYMANYIRRLVPEAEVGIAHGQMPEGQLENAMMDFAEGKIDVLLCTTIIESGLDIQNVNTLIVNRADTFGLAQLYQLRGRVGRS